MPRSNVGIRYGQPQCANASDYAKPRARRRRYVRQCIRFGFSENGSRRFALPPGRILTLLFANPSPLSYMEENDRTPVRARLWRCGKV